MAESQNLTELDHGSGGHSRRVGFNLSPGLQAFKKTSNFVTCHKSHTTVQSVRAVNHRGPTVTVTLVTGPRRGARNGVTQGQVNSHKFEHADGYCFVFSEAKFITVIDDCDSCH
jgi:hypothetical protein